VDRLDRDVVDAPKRHAFENGFVVAFRQLGHQV
jgi:hypothetical protein